jgi:hypothetical protein
MQLTAAIGHLLELAPLLWLTHLIIGSVVKRGNEPLEEVLGRGPGASDP